MNGLKNTKLQNKETRRPDREHCVSRISALPVASKWRWARLSPSNTDGKKRSASFSLAYSQTHSWGGPQTRASCRLFKACRGINSRDGGAAAFFFGLWKARRHREMRLLPPCLGTLTPYYPLQPRPLALEQLKDASCQDSMRPSQESKCLYYKSITWQGGKNRL